MGENKLVNGFYVKSPHERAPDFVLQEVSINVNQFFEFMRDNKNDAGYLNLQILRSKEGKPYAVLNNYTPKPKENDNSSFRPDNVDMDGNKEEPFKMFKPDEDEPFEDDIPF